MAAEHIACPQHTTDSLLDASSIHLSCLQGELQKRQEQVGNLAAENRRCEWQQMRRYYLE
jgi:hypothetical protein